MLSIRTVDPITASLIFGNLPLLADDGWEAYVKRCGVMALAAEEEGNLVGWAVAESCPHRLHILGIEGDTETCQMLLDRLVKAAGERDLSGWLARDRPDIRQLFKRLGFFKGRSGISDGVPSVFYFWDRNADV